MKNFIWRHKFAFVIFLILFVVPSFWFKRGEVDYGGDSTRLYFYDSDSWLKNIALYFINPLSSLGRDMPNFFIIPFLLFLSFLKHFFSLNGHQLNNIFNGLLLSGGFFFVYLIAEELKNNGKLSLNSNMSSIIAGLFFILSPVTLFQWERALYGIGQVFIYPLVFYLFLKFLHTSKYKYIIFAGIASLIFSVNFSYATLPWFFAFFPISFIFLFFYSNILGIKKLFFKGLILFALLCFLLISFDNLVQIFNFISPYGLSNRMLFSNEITENRALPYFLSINGHVRLIYNLLNQDQYVISKGFGNPFAEDIFKFGIRFLPIFFIYPVTVCFGLILVKKNLVLLQRKTINLLAIFFLICLFLVSANITGLGVTIYKTLFRLSWFAMFRSYVSKFSFVYIFFYSLFFSYCLSVVLDYLKLKIKIILTFFITFLIIFNGWPLLSGIMAKGKLWRSNNVPYASEIDPEYEKFITEVKKLPDGFKFFSLPFANEDYQVLQGKNGGVYFGPSSIPILTGKNTFSGQTGFNMFWPFLETLFSQKKYSVVSRLLPFLNIGYVFYNSSDYIYKNFPNYPYSDWLRQNNFSQKSIKNIVESLNIEKVFSVDDYNLYRFDENNLLPLIYSPEKLVVSGNGVEIMPQEISLNGFRQKTAFVLQNSFSGQEKNAPAIFDVGNEYVVSGKSSEIEDMETAVYAESQMGTYTSVRKLNFIKLLINLTVDKIESLKLKSEKRYSVNEALILLNKRLSDVIANNKFEKILLFFYKNQLNEVLEMVKKEQNYKTKIILSAMLKNNLKDNLRRLQIDKPKNYDLWEKIINSALPGFQKRTQFSILKRNYELNIPQDGDYEVFVDETSPVKTSSLSITMKGCDFEIPDQDNLKIKVSEKPLEITNEGWLKLGSVNLSKGKKKADLNLCGSNNQLFDGDWKKYLPIGDKDGLTMVEGYSFPPSSFIYSKDIVNWESETWYRIEGKIKTEEKTILAVGEKRKRWITVHKKLQLLEKMDIVKTIEINSEQGENFSFDIKSSLNALESKIFIYQTIDKEIGTLQQDNVGIEDIDVKVSIIYNPRLFLRFSKNGISSLGNQPKIVFNKINPTKYLVKVSDAKNPYILVFSDFFHPNWKIKTADSIDINQLSPGKKFSFLSELISFAKWTRSRITEDRHFSVNGYANGWLITPSDFDQKASYEFVIEFWPQRIFYFGAVISIFTLSLCLFFLLINLFKNFISKCQRNQK